MGDEILFERGACSALVITCSDFRFKTVERILAESSKLRDDYDLIARPGGIRSLVAPRNEAARESMEEEILLLWNLHGFSRLLMVNHMSCRAYDDLTAREDERMLHRKHLLAAGSLIERRYKGVTPEAYLVGLVDGALQVQRLSATKS